MVEATSKPVVLITGITGYLGMYVTLDFLRDGSFKVRGTVRSTAPENLKHLKTAFGKLFDELELVVADIENETQVEKAVAGATYVVHTASPVVYKEPTDGGVAIVRTAVEGALITLRASHKAGVKRVVLTSSIAAIRDMFPKDRLPHGVPYTEEHWSDIEFQKTQAMYKVSKTLQERSAWDFVNKLSGPNKMELVTLCPSLLIGPALHGKEFVSGQMLNDFFLNKVPPTRSKFSYIDVRDVAKAHVLAVKVPEAAGQRFILNGLTLWVPDMIDIFNKEFSKQGYTASKRAPPYAVLYIASFFVKNVSRLLNILDNDYIVSTEKAQKVLGMQFSPVEPAMIEYLYQAIKVGHIKDPRKPMRQAKL